MAPRRKAAKSQTTQVKQQQQQPQNALPVELQQLILNQFTNAFPFSSLSDLKATIQTVKGHLYNRDFASAFGQSSYLNAYAVRWSAARALGYADLFRSLHSCHDLLGSGTDRKQVVCIGGGAGAEVVALAAAIARTGDGASIMTAIQPRLHTPTNEAITQSSQPPPPPPPPSSSSATPSLSITAIDIANWSTPLTTLHHTLTNPPPLSTYATSTAKANNRAFIDPAQLHVDFIQQDILSADWDANATLNSRFSKASLVTIMFTLNELFSASRAKTTRLLLQGLTEQMRVGAGLLVVDSPGSYSEVALGSSTGDTQSQVTEQGKGDEEKAAMTMTMMTKKYPMKWLLDHTLMEVAKGKWEKVLEDDGRWFRVNRGGDREVRYAVEVENMRYQVHYYRRIG